MRAAVQRTGDAGGAQTRPGLWQDFARGVRDNAAAEFGVQLIRLCAIVVLARALTPADFGLFKILVVVSFIAIFTSQAGIPDTLVQRKDLRPEHESTAWWLSVIFTALTVVLLFAAAPMIARLMAMPALDPAVRLLCLSIFLEGTSATADARLRRDLKFGMLAMADLSAELAFLTVALTLLWSGLPRWSLAGGLAARLAVHGLALWMTGGEWPKSILQLAAARDMSRFAFSVWSGRLIVIAASNFDFVLVGRMLGSSALGFYAMAWDLLRFIPDRLSRVAGRVALPAFCKLQDDDPELSRAYRNFFNQIGRLVIPIAACVALAAPELLAVIYGEQWAPAALPLRLLAPGLTLVGLRVGMGAVFYAKDYPSYDVFLNGSRIVLIAVAVFTLARFGLSGVSVGMSIVEGVVSIAGIWLACRLIGLRIWSLLSSALPGFRTACLCVLATGMGRTVVLHSDLHGLWGLMLLTAPPAAMFCWIEAANVRELIHKAFGRRVAATA